MSPGELRRMEDGRKELHATPEKKLRVTGYEVMIWIDFADRKTPGIINVCMYLLFFK